ncbi:MAG: PAS domain S-box protein [Spirochaetes bacterium]|nr:PAS domain S-box protein [Spirochaetota bacterium]
MNIISLLDTLSVLMSLAAILIIIMDRKSRFPKDVKYFFIFLIFIIVIYNLLNTLEWFIVNRELSREIDIYGDFLGILIPTLWGFFFYIFLGEISDREIRESREKYRLLIETSSDWVWELDQNGSYSYSSPKVQSLLGYKPEEVMGKKPFHFMPPDEAERVEAIIRVAMQSKKPLKGMVNLNRHKDGHLVVLETGAEPFFDEQGEYLGYRGINRDITESKRAHRELRESELRYRVIARERAILLEIAVAISRSFNLNEILHSVAEKILELTGTDIASIILLDENRNLTMVSLVGLDRESKIIKIAQKDLAEGRTSFLKKMLKIKKPKLLHSYKELKTNFTLFEQIKSLKLKSTVFFPIKSHKGTVGIGTLSSKSYHELNPNESQMLESVGNTIGIAVENSRLYETLKKVNVGLEKMVLDRTKELDQARLNALSMALDIKEAYKKLKKTQKKLLQSERLAVIGRMAAMVSHELKNPLAGMKISTYYLKHLLKGKDRKVETILRNINKEIDRSSNIISDILTLSRGFVLNKSTVDVNSLIEEVLSSIKKKMNFFDITIKLRLSKLPKVRADKDKLTQVFINLIVNAREAMAGGGHLTIHTMMKNNKVEIAVTDTGVGISPDKMKKVFEPFFSDKVKGTGLGLTLVNEIIRKHKGHVKVKSKVGQGTTFLIQLPLND